MSPSIETNDARINDTSASPDMGTRFYNEAYVIANGLLGSGRSIKESAVEAWQNPGTTTLQVAVSTAFGFGVGCLSTRAGITGIAAKGVATAAGLSFLNEGIKPWREAMSTAWNARNEAELETASQQFSRQLGQFTFDTLIMTPGAVGGAMAGAKFALARSKPLSPAIEIKVPVERPIHVDARADLSKAPKVVTDKPPATNGQKPFGTYVRQRPYRYEQLDPASPNNKRFDFGIEVSDPRLLNGQRNLDHHSSRDTATTPSAAEQALALPDSELPKPGSVLATIRPDPDSLTAMAVLANRNEARAVNRRLVEAIGRRDRGIKDPPPGESYADLKDMIDAISFNARSTHHELFKKVYFVKDCLDARINMELVQTLASRQRNSVRERHARIETEMKVETLIPDRLVLVKSDSSLALSHGYRYAPVVILHHENPHFTRFSVGTEHKSDVGKYLGRALRELRGIEEGWGGRSSIFGSPQDRSTQLKPEQVATVVKKYIDPPAYKRYWWEAMDFLAQRRPVRWFVSQ